MALVPVTMLYDTKDVIDATGLLNGQILYTIDQTINKIYADVLVDGTLKRIEIGGTNTIDTVLDQDSGHAIANSAVAKLAQTVHTNLLNPTLGTTTINGVTCTDNGDGTYTLNGTCTASQAIRFYLKDNTPVKTGKKYRLVGCPSGGSGTTYKISVYGETVDTYVGADVGNGFNFTASRDSCDISIVVYPNTTVEDLVFKPMLTTDTSATYDDFVQYSGDGELNENVADLYNNLNTTNSNLTALDTKVGAQSLLPTPSQSVTQNINTLKAEIDQINSDLSDKQNKTDNSLTTTNKTIVGAINELDSDMSNVSETFFQNSLDSYQWIHAHYNAKTKLVVVDVCRFVAVANGTTIGILSAHRPANQQVAYCMMRNSDGTTQFGNFTIDSTGAIKIHALSTNTDIAGCAHFEFPASS